MKFPRSLSLVVLALLVFCSPVAANAASGHRLGQRHAHGSRHRQHKQHHHRRHPKSPVKPTAAEVLAREIAATLATPCANTELLPSPSNLVAVDAATLCLINQERARHNIVPLRVNPRLERAAEAHDQEMIALDYFAHISPGGITPVDRDRDEGYIPNPQDGYIIGENLAWGTLSLSTPQSIAEAWFASPEHLANILEGEYKETGIAVVPEVPASLSGGSPGALYAQEFGVVVR
jgi:uncharacterized protein YkwD